MSDYLSQQFAYRTLPYFERFIEWVNARVPQYLEAGYEPIDAYKAALAEGIEETKALSDEYKAHLQNKYPPGKAVDGKLTLTLGELLDNNRSHIAKVRRRRMLDGVRKYVVYIVRNGEEVLYVGATNFDPENRIRNHVSGRSALGKAIRREVSSGKWTVELIAHPDKSTARAKEKELQIQFRPKFCNDRFLKKEQPLCQQS